MSRIVRGGLIQASVTLEGRSSRGIIKQAMIENHLAGLSEYFCRLEQPGHALANPSSLCAIHRVGRELRWDIGEFYGQSYFRNPCGELYAVASRDQDELLVADMDLDLVTGVSNVGQSYRVHHIETYGVLVSP